MDSLSAQFSKTKPSGPLTAEVMFVGEAPGATEEVRGVPFVGRSGDEFDKMLVESGWLAEDTPEAVRLARDSTYFLTNACKYRPPENKIEAFFLDSKRRTPNALLAEGIAELHAEIRRVKPKVVVALGDTALWAITQQHGITKWRGSMLEITYRDDSGKEFRSLLLPTYHPALILREWSWRSIAVFDLSRAREALNRGAWPEWKPNFLVRPSFPDVMDVLNTLLRRANGLQHQNDGSLQLASDLETRRKYIACHSIAWSDTDALCIPNLCVERAEGYWSLDQDLAIWAKERELLTHPNVEVIGQNYLYDAQYFARRRGYVPRLRHDTMFMQHVAWAGLPKGLDFLRSMYCRYNVYWKDDGKEWNPKIPEEQFWVYGCTDAVVTFEAAQALISLLNELQLYDLYRFQMRLWWPVLRMMLRGVRIDLRLRDHIAGELLSAVTDREQRLQYILGYTLNLKSSKQVHNLFYDQLKCRVVLDRKTKRPTCDEDALVKFQQEEPLLRPICQLITEVRALASLKSNVIEAPVNYDGRMRSSFNPAATETLRFNSGKSGFDEGTNMQNWTKGDEEE